MPPSLDALLTKAQRDPATQIKVVRPVPDINLIFSGKEELIYHVLAFKYCYDHLHYFYHYNHYYYSYSYFIFLSFFLLLFCLFTGCLACNSHLITKKHVNYCRRWFKYKLNSVFSGLAGQVMRTQCFGLNDLDWNKTETRHIHKGNLLTLNIL